MSQRTFEQVLVNVQTLSAAERAKLRAVLDAPDQETQQREAARELARLTSQRDFSADRQWLQLHRDEYAGQWVALKYGELICHGPELKSVYAAANAAGHPDALFTQVEPSDALPFLL